MDADSLRLEIHKMHAENRTKTMQAHLQSITAFAQAAIRGAFILNGAAAVAGFTAFNAIGKDAAIPIIATGAWGAFWAVVCSGLSYLSQRVYMAADLYGCNKGYCESFDKPMPPREIFERYGVGNLFIIGAIFSFSASLYVFIFHGLLCLPEIFAKFSK